MNKLIVVCGLLLVVNSLDAQYQVKPGQKQAFHQRMVSGLLGQNGNGLTATNARTTSGTTMQRVIAQSTKDSTGVYYDSVNLKYSLERWSTYDYNTMVYPYNYAYNVSPMFGNSQGVFPSPQVLCDTYRHWEVDPNTLTYGFYESGYSTYNTANNQVGYLYLNADSSILVAEGFSSPNMLYANRFNSLHNIDSGYWFNWQSGAADSAFKQFFTYNSSDKLTKDSTYELHLGVWRLVSKTIYTYDGANDLTQIDNYANDTDTSFLQPLVELFKYVNTYDASHRLTSTSSSFFDQVSLLPYIEDTFAYTGTYNYHIAWREYQMDPINGYWAPMFNMTKILNTSGLPDTVNKEGFDSILNAWVPMTRYVATYNSYNNPDTLKEFDYNYTYFPAVPSYTTLYYYGTYSATGVNQVPVASGKATVFPNPTTGTVYIAGLEVPVNSMISVSVTDIKGQLVTREQMSWQNEASLDLEGLLPGVYWLAVYDANGQQLCEQAVVRR